MSEKAPKSANSENQELKNLDWSDINPVIDDIQSRRQSVKDEIDAIKSVPGFRYDTGEMGKAQAIRRIQQKEENVALEDEWKRYGGEAIDVAQSEYDTNEAKGLNKDLGDRLVLQAKLSEAKKRYYLNQLAEQAPASEDSKWDSLAEPNPEVDEPNPEMPEEADEEPNNLYSFNDLPAESVGNPPVQGYDIDIKGKELVLYSGKSKEMVLYSDKMELFDGPARDEFLKYVAKSEKGHFNKGRLKVDGKVQMFLRTAFGKTGAKLADKLTRRTSQEEELAKNYTESLKTKEVAFLTGFEPGTKEYNARKAEFITSQHAADALRIAELQKEDPRKPINKWVRRAGYVAAGVAGGAIATTPIGWAAGAAVAFGGAGAIQAYATKRNAWTKEKGSENLVVDQLAKKRTEEFNKNVDESKDGKDALGAENLADQHLYNKNKEVEDNRKGLRGPLAIAALGFLASRGMAEGIHHLNNSDNSAVENHNGRMIDSARDGADGVADEMPKKEEGGGGIIDIPQGGPEIIDTSESDTPWSWIAKEVGPEKAMSELHRLSEIASQNGYDVVWNNIGDGNDLNDWIRINGKSDTDSVVNILNQFR